ncbi:MAG: hypothetical protein M1829_002378 [Trizodia sp. TS-e1964]|nr:MAG: hypothetical protein M1829_002378 [Trizodia sp. TS-e1964]
MKGHLSLLILGIATGSASACPPHRHSKLSSTSIPTTTSVISGTITATALGSTDGTVSGPVNRTVVGVGAVNATSSITSTTSVATAGLYGSYGGYSVSSSGNQTSAISTDKAVGRSTSDSAAGSSTTPAGSLTITPSGTTTISGSGNAYTNQIVGSLGDYGSSVQGSAGSYDGSVVVLSVEPSSDCGPEIPPGYINFSLDSMGFIKYAGEPGIPNMLSINLLTNLGDRMGTMPMIRFFGDYTKGFDQNLTKQSHVDSARNLVIGPTYFDSASNFPNTKFMLGLNFMDLSDQAKQTMLGVVKAVCTHMKPSQIAMWEMGNEPDLYVAQGARPAGWTVDDYVREWRDHTGAVRAVIAQKYAPFPQNFVATSVIGKKSDTVPAKAFKAGLNQDNSVSIVGVHNYLTVATRSGNLLVDFVMNHAVISDSIKKNVGLLTDTRAAGVNLPFIFSETNSLALGGKDGASNVFGASLYQVDFCLKAASGGILSIFHHQGSGASYNAWDPNKGTDLSGATGAPYYGQLFVAEILGKAKTRVAEIPINGGSTESAYAVYEGGKLARIAAVNFNYYGGSGDRPARRFQFKVPGATEGATVTVLLLTASSASTKTGITFAGNSYDANTVGKANKTCPGGVTSITVGKDGLLQFSVRDSEALMLILP